MIDLRKWADWWPWEAMDPGMEKTYSGAESGVGSRYAWSGNRKVGQGNMEIVGATPNEKVEIALEFITPFKASNATALAFTEEAGGTRVRWTMTGKSTLILRIMGIFRSMDTMIGRDFEKGLAQLKAVAEASRILPVAPAPSEGPALQRSPDLRSAQYPARDLP